RPGQAEPDLVRLARGRRRGVPVRRPPGVPYLFGGLGGVVSGGGPIDRGADFVLVVGGGVDWLVSRERSLGLEARIASFGGDITVGTCGVRGTVRWGEL